MDDCSRRRQGAVTLLPGQRDGLQILAAAQAYLLRCCLGQRPLRASSRVRASHLHLRRSPSSVAYPAIRVVKSILLLEAATTLWLPLLFTPNQQQGSGLDCGEQQEPPLLSQADGAIVPLTQQFSHCASHGSGIVTVHKCRLWHRTGRRNPQPEPSLDDDGLN